MHEAMITFKGYVCVSEMAICIHVPGGSRENMDINCIESSSTSTR